MGLQELAENAQLFFLIFVRVFAVLKIAPLISSQAVPRIARIALAFFTSFMLFPWILELGYPIPRTGLSYAFLLIGEILTGIIIGFMLVIIYSAFQVSGQFFSLQMGFGASQVFDPLAQVQIPIMGQFLNLIAMLVFIVIGGFEKLFLMGIYGSFKALRAVDIMLTSDNLFQLMIGALSRLFQTALLIALPILGTLFLISISVGLLAKAAPQMNLLMMGFPIAIGVAFLVLFMAMPFLVEAFSRIITASFQQLGEFLDTFMEAEQ